MPDTSGRPDHSSRGQVVRDLLVFQAKLWLEGFKDVVLMPLALGAGILDLLFRKPKHKGYIYAVMKLGDRFETWVNLYGALDAVEPGTSKRSDPLDDVLGGAGISTTPRRDRTRSKGAEAESSVKE